MSGKEPDKPYEEYMKTLKCDCCGDEIINLNWVECVLNPYECLCMRCYRAADGKNAWIAHDHAENYRLARDLEEAENDIRREKQQVINAREERNNAIEEKETYVSKTTELIEEGYALALKSESAAAIEILRNLKENISSECK
jgi:hypothetical protein